MPDELQELIGEVFCQEFTAQLLEHFKACPECREKLIEKAATLEGLPFLGRGIKKKFAARGGLAAALKQSLES